MCIIALIADPFALCDILSHLGNPAGSANVCA
jgi:hypothetical protein